MQTAGVPNGYIGHAYPFFSTTPANESLADKLLRCVLAIKAQAAGLPPTTKHPMNSAPMMKRIFPKRHDLNWSCMTLGGSDFPPLFCASTTAPKTPHPLHDYPKKQKTPAIGGPNFGPASGAGGASDPSWLTRFSGIYQRSCRVSKYNYRYR